MKKNHEVLKNIFFIGTGIAPFRSFWQEMEVLKTSDASITLPTVLLFSGCRTKGHEIYMLEKTQMHEAKVITENYTALSRDLLLKKVSIIVSYTC